MRTRPITDTMRDALRVMATTGARIEWDGYNRWILPDGSEEFRIDVRSQSFRAPTCTVSDALERRGLIERSCPPPKFRTTYTISDKGREVIK
jgi:hypothetical protein